ncbi:putative ferric-chelate reductase 1 [Dendronephthya gigantea]|uniref:putative ferric-chelate reductase 1 n=1 Tax=Dendronephthya gigantea TaxID=151771 RepID=UPI001069A5C7|nr:putative ferric-chelate reductase 1 [Dendronephthya gigantea]
MWKSIVKVMLLWMVLYAVSCVSSQLLDKAGCNSTISCYSQPPSCTSSKDCKYLLKYSVQNNEIIDFNLSSNTFEWIAVGFNPKNPRMAGGESLVCERYIIKDNENIILRHYNMKTEDRPYPSQDTNATLVSRSKSGNILSCRIQRKLDLQVIRRNNLRKPVYFLYAAGMTDSKHDPVWIKEHTFSRAPRYPLNVFDVSDNTDTSKAMKRIDTSQCGKSLGCLRTPSSCNDNTDCDYLLTFRKNSNDILFSLSGKSDGWVSVGFNDKPKMGGTDAVICQAKGTNSAYLWVANLKYNTPKLITPNETRILDGKFEDGIIYCKFTRPLKPTAKKRVAIDIPRYIIYAKGKGVAKLHEHADEDKGCSEKKVDFGNHISYDLGDCGGGLERVHGSFMIFSWMFLVIISIFIARYSRSLWLGLKIFGSDAWFQFHRLIMGIAVLFTIVAIIIIFTDKGGWSESAGAHGKLGIVVMVLAIIQPTIAFFRPHPRKPRRVLFNWFHRIVALLLVILAVVTVFKGSELLFSDENNVSKCVIALIVVALVTALVLEYLAFRIRAKSSPSVGLASETLQEENSIVAESFWETKLQRVLLVVFSLVVFIQAAVMIAYVAGAGEDDDDDD